jgi:hypothetical protein
MKLEYRGAFVMPGLAIADTMLCDRIARTSRQVLCWTSCPRGTRRRKRCCATALGRTADVQPDGSVEASFRQFHVYTACNVHSTYSIFYWQEMRSSLLDALHWSTCVSVCHIGNAIPSSLSFSVPHQS